MNFPPHPRLLFSQADLAAIHVRIGRTVWARAFYEELTQRCDAWLGRAVELPRGGQWWHWYACPEHGTRLRTEGPTRHVCPTGGEVFTGYPYDDVVLSRDHDALAVAARRGRWICHITLPATGRSRCAMPLRRLLLMCRLRLPTVRSSRPMRRLPPALATLASAI